jgi:hypothetical protein
MISRHPARAVGIHHWARLLLISDFSTPPVFKGKLCVMETIQGQSGPEKGLLANPITRSSSVCLSEVEVVG